VVKASAIRELFLDVLCEWGGAFRHFSVTDEEVIVTVRRRWTLRRRERAAVVDDGPSSVGRSPVVLGIIRGRQERSQSPAQDGVEMLTSRHEGTLARLDARGPAVSFLRRADSRGLSRPGRAGDSKGCVHEG
jgi:hypothetical protein